MINLSCPHCQSEQIIKRGRRYYQNGRSQPKYSCKVCNKVFTRENFSRKSKAAGMDCPHCGSSNTKQNRKPEQRSYGKTQGCLCKDCGRYFTKGKRKKLHLYIQGKLVVKLWESTIYNNYDPDIVCPNCQEHKTILWSQPKKSSKRQSPIYLCIGCGQKFTGFGNSWNVNIKRQKDLEIPLEPWNFKEDVWDLRELYPDVDDYDLCQLFIRFDSYSNRDFKNYLKEYILQEIQRGLKINSLLSKMTVMKQFLCFLEQKNINKINELDRFLLSRYFQENRSHLSALSLKSEMYYLKDFFDWIRQAKHLSISKTLLTKLDIPKTYQNDPDPLEDNVLETIRNNIHILPETFQLQFMLGFWLGARPGELSKLSKNCVSLDPDGKIWWLEFERHKQDDQNRLPITTDLVRLIQKQQEYINKLFGPDYPYLFCHYRFFKELDYPKYSSLEPVKRPPLPYSDGNTMVRAIRHLIKFCQIKDSNGEEVNFVGKILRPTRATHLIQNGSSLEFVRIWLKHKSARTTYKHYVRYRPGEMLDVATVMANLDNKFYPYESNPEALGEQFQDLRQNPELHELDGLTTIGGVPLIGYCLYRDFCPRFHHCYGCGFHVASSDKLSLYKEQLAQLKAKETEVFNLGSAEMLGGYEDTIRKLEAIIAALESQHG